MNGESQKPYATAARWTGGQRTVVLLDDEPLVLRAEARLLRSVGLVVLATSDPAQAYAHVEEERPDVVVSDLHMPSECGARFLERVANVAPSTARVLLSGDPDFRPKSGNLPSARVHAVLTKTEIGLLPHIVVETLSARSAAADDDAATVAVARRFAAAMSRPSFEDDAHRERCAAWTSHLCRLLGAPASEILEGRMLGLLHDVGNIAVPPHVFARSGALTKVDLYDVRQHVEAGARIVADVPALSAYADLVALHQERFDGTGYPTGSAGSDVPLAVRAFHVVDAYDAMTSGRPYRKPRSHTEAIRELTAGEGTAIDPTVGRAFAQLGEAALRQIIDP